MERVKKYIEEKKLGLMKNRSTLDHSFQSYSANIDEELIEEELELDLHHKSSFKYEAKKTNFQMQELELNYDELESLFIELQLDEENLINRFSQSNEDIDSLTIEIYNVENSIKKLKESNHNLNDEVSCLDTQVQKLRDKKHSIELLLNKENERIGSQKDLLKKNKKLSRWLERQTETLKEEVNELRNEKERLTISIISFEKRADEKRLECLEYKKEIALYGVELLDLRNILHNLEAERLELKNEHDRFLRDIALAATDRDGFKLAISDLKEENILLRDRLTKGEVSIDALQEEKEELKSSHTQLDIDYKELCLNYDLVLSDRKNIEQEVEESSRLYQLLQKRYSDEKKKINIEMQKKLKLKPLVHKTKETVKKSSSIVNELVDQNRKLLESNEIMSVKCAEMNKVIVKKRKEANKLSTLVKVNEMRKSELIAKNSRIEKELTKLDELIGQKSAHIDLTPLKEKNLRLRRELESKEQELINHLDKSNSNHITKITRVRPGL